MTLPALDMATASAIAAVVGRLVQAPTSRVVVQLLRGERPTAEGVDPGRLDDLIGVLSRPGYLQARDEDLSDATAALGLACGLDAEVSRRMLQRGLSVTGATHRVFLRSGGTTALLEEVERANSPEKHELRIPVPWDPWRTLDAVAGLAEVEVPPWRVPAGADATGRLWQVEADAAVIASAGGPFYSDEAHAMVVQLGDLVGRLAAIATELADGR